MSFLNSNQISTLTGQFFKHWQTFSAFNTITVNKEPAVSITDLNADVLPGYGTTSNESNLTYTPVYSSFSAMVKYPNQNEDTLMENIKVTLTAGQCLIKVDEGCRNYINTDKTLNIQVDGKLYKEIAEERVQNYLGLKFYYFKLGQTT